MTATKAVPAIDEILATLQRAYRKPKLHDSTDIIEQLLYAVLQKWYPAAKCEVTVKAFREEFVDWNELRVSHVTEIEPILQRFELDEVHAASQALRDALVGYHLLRNDLEFEFLAEMGLEERERFWAGIPSLDASMIHYLALCREPEGTILHQVDLARVAQRLNLIGKSSSSKKTVKDLEDLGENVDRLLMQLGLIRIGIETCDARDPACDLCRLASLCPLSSKVIADKKVAEKKAAEQRAAEERAAEAARLAAEKQAEKAREKQRKIEEKEAAIAAKAKAKADAERLKIDKAKAAEKAKLDKKLKAEKAIADRKTQAADKKAKVAAAKEAGERKSKPAAKKAPAVKKAPAAKKPAAAPAKKAAATKSATAPAKKAGSAKKATEKKSADKKSADKKSKSDSKTAAKKTAKKR